MEVARKRCRLGSVYVIEEPMVWDLEDVIKFLENAMNFLRFLGPACLGPGSEEVNPAVS